MRFQTSIPGKHTGRSGQGIPYQPGGAGSLGRTFARPAFRMPRQKENSKMRSSPLRYPWETTRRVFCRRTARPDSTSFETPLEIAASLQAGRHYYGRQRARSELRRGGHAPSLPGPSLTRTILSLQRSWLHFAVSAVEPGIFAIAPAPAVGLLLERAGWRLTDVDRVRNQ